MKKDGSKIFNVLGIEDMVLWGKQYTVEGVKYTLLGCDENYIPVLHEIENKTIRSINVCPLVFINHITKIDKAEFIEQEINAKLTLLEETEETTNKLKKTREYFKQEDSNENDSVGKNKGFMTISMFAVALVTMMVVKFI